MALGTQLATLGEGLLATLFAGLQLVGWIGLGAPLARRLRRDELAAPCALLAGAATTSFAYALLTAAGHVGTAIGVGIGLSAAGLVAGGRWALACSRRLAAAFGEAVRGRLLRLAASGFAVVAWALTISPPRDADVMRYHLAHIRQIVQDGGWNQIADYTYALPFGWTLNYLPFEWAGLPVGAQMLDLGLWAMTIAVLFRLGTRLGSRLAVLSAVGVLVVLQPSMLKLGTTAHADAYIVLVCAVIISLLLSTAEETRTTAPWLGFAAFVGLQSRYQAAALAIATTAVVAAALRKRRDRTATAWRYAVGAMAGIALAAPFYARNLLEFRNPFWPVLAGRIEPTTTPAGSRWATTARSTARSPPRPSRTACGRWRRTP